MHVKALSMTVQIVLILYVTHWAILILPCHVLLFRWRFVTLKYNLILTMINLMGKQCCCNTLMYSTGNLDHLPQFFNNFSPFLSLFISFVLYLCSKISRTTMHLSAWFNPIWTRSWGQNGPTPGFSSVAQKPLNQCSSNFVTVIIIIQAIFQN